MQSPFVSESLVFIIHFSENSAKHLVLYFLIQIKLKLFQLLCCTGLIDGYIYSVLVTIVFCLNVHWKVKSKSVTQIIK